MPGFRGDPGPMGNQGPIGQEGEGCSGPQDCSLNAATPPGCTSLPQTQTPRARPAPPKVHEGLSDLV